MRQIVSQSRSSLAARPVLVLRAEPAYKALNRE